MKYPEMRVELLGYLKDLSDFDYQKDCWVNGKCPAGIQHDELDYSVHFLFDDTGLADDPDGQIGVFLNSKEEAEVVEFLCKKLQKIFDIYGTDLSDQEYINCPEWKDVIDAARLALTKLS
jgi:ABC-type glycerol-3-phosphate transport system substrate-binding protein